MYLLMSMQFGLRVCVVERKLYFSSFKTFGIMLLHVIICLMNCRSNYSLLTISKLMAISNVNSDLKTFV